jgi:glycosyltransferase involved in cell wall biosynthesis
MFSPEPQPTPASERAARFFQQSHWVSRRFHAFSDSLEKVLGEDRSRQDLMPPNGSAARARVEREFSERLMVERYLDLYARMVRGET